MMIQEYFEQGYRVVVEGQYGDFDLEVEDMECYVEGEDVKFSRVDEEEKVAYYSEIMGEQWDI